MRREAEKRELYSEMIKTQVDNSVLVSKWFLNFD